MKVKMAILQTTGTAEFEIDAKDLNEAHEKLRKGEGLLVKRTIETFLYNFDTLEELPQEESEDQAH
jgi:hypothetical protein